MKTKSCFFGLLLLVSQFAIDANGQRIDNRARKHLPPTRIVWQSDSAESYIQNSHALLKEGNSQAVLVNTDLCIFKNTDDQFTSILLDFGKEIHGGIEFVTGNWADGIAKKVRVRLGESVSEAMSELNDESNAENDHAIRDQVVLLPWLGSKVVGNSGFRFARIDFVDVNSTLVLKEVNAISVYHDIPYLGSFESSDALLNQIWKTGAYTVHLNIQNYLWDGIKRDRLVWVGDMHPEIKTINSVFGNNDVVTRSLDLIRDSTPLPGWMNGISSYSMWWILIHYEWYQQYGDLDYLKEQRSYIIGLMNLFCSKVDENGNEHLDGNRFLDWPSSPYSGAVDAGYHALLKITLEQGAKLLSILDEKKTAKLCLKKAAKMQKISLEPVGSKQAASLMFLADMMKKNEAVDIILKNGDKDFSTFYGYYMLQALAKSGHYKEAIEIIRSYWGGMLSLGATTFWEDFNTDWLDNAGRIDELPVEGKIDVHATYGEFCYIGLRHSLCHGWASGPTSWLSEHVLGIKVVDTGSKKICIDPHLGDLKWARGTYPTPYGVLKVEHKVDADGIIKTIVDAPKGIQIVYECGEYKSLLEK